MEQTTRETKPRRLVVKIGSSTLTAGSDRLNRPQMLELVRQMAHLHQQGVDIIVVTSGAMVTGREVLGFPKGRKDIPYKQVLAAVGQARLMQVWDQLFSLYGLVVAQTLLTREDLADRQRYLNARSTLLALLEHSVIPIVNENDVVGVEEIKIGDNDNLSALVCNVIDADLLVLLTDIAGLYTADPRQDANATLIPEVHAIDAAIEAVGGKAGSDRGVGGMATKIQAARLATGSGATVVIADGSVPDVLERLARGESIGTRFVPSQSNVESRRRWIISGLASRGEVTVDNGAAAALLRGGKSLLPAGIAEVHGHFERGDTITIKSTTGKKLACGVANYSSADMDKVRGFRSNEIETILGYEFGEEAVHRNNMVLV
jgi:glutamate 5-kinase